MRKYEAPELKEVARIAKEDILCASGENGMTWDNDSWKNTNDWE